MRLFLAVPVPVDLAKATAPFTNDGFRPVPLDTWHLTLRFLGHADPDDVVQAMEGFQAQAMEARFTETSAFPDARRASVVWLGVDADGLDAVARDVRERVQDIGLTDKKSFVPHITLGRCRRPMDLRRALSESEIPSERFPIDRVDLMASELMPEGPLYSVVRSWAL